MREPRDLWVPVLGEFAIRPWEMELLTPDELDAIGQYLKRLSK